MAITDKKTGVWGLDQVYNKENQGSIWTYSGTKELWSWGNNTYGNLGQNNRTAYSSPVQIPCTLDGTIASSMYSNLATKSDGTLWSWGKNSNGD